MYTYTTYQVEGTSYGYRIFKDGTLIIEQPFFPIYAGKQPMSQVQAGKVADGIITFQLNYGQSAALQEGNLQFYLNR